MTYQDVLDALDEATNAIIENRQKDEEVEVGDPILEILVRHIIPEAICMDCGKASTACDCDLGEET